MRKLIQTLIADALQKSFSLQKEVLVDIPKDGSADYSVNTALQCAKELGQTPKEIAETLVANMKNFCHSHENGNPVPQSETSADGGYGSQIKSGMTGIFEKIEVIGAGFIYFTLSKNALTQLFSEENWGESSDFDTKKIMVEFATPNTHKAFHIGHLRNICLGESFVRLLESQGNKIFRANYQGDIGPQVAKCIWGIFKNYQSNEIHYSSVFDYLNTIQEKTPQEKANFLGVSYSTGGRSYESDDQVKKEIQAINKELYLGPNEELKKVYEISRQWSLEYFEYIYHRLGTRSFDEYFFESQTWKSGKELVEKHIGTVFTESNGAIVFEGENFGLHTRVFISSEGTPTYEAKDMGLAPIEAATFPFDSCIHVVANEQAEYFKVVFKALEFIFPEIAKKEKHLSYGMVKLTSGKMSSRTGDVITAEWLLNEAKNAILEILKIRDLSAEEKERIAEQVAVGAIKFTMLHTQAKNDIAFDLEKAVRLDGDSGPYIQYAHARICSILKKNAPPCHSRGNGNPLSQSETSRLAGLDPRIKSEDDSINIDFSEFNEADWQLVRKIQYFPYHVSRCAKELTAHHLSHYLLQLTAEFSSWYANNSVQNAETENLKFARVELLKFLQKTLQQGLFYLGIEAPEKM